MGDRHLQGTANVRFAGGGFTLGVGLVLLSLGRKAETDQERRKCYGWSAFFLVDATLQSWAAFWTWLRPAPHLPEPDLRYSHGLIGDAQAAASASSSNVDR